MKKVLSVLICVSVILTSCICFAQAFESNTNDLTDYPCIMVAGYSSSKLTMPGEDGSTVLAWNGLDVGEMGSMALTGIAEIGKGLVRLTAGDAKYIADVVGEGAVKLYGQLACKPDGTSKNDISRAVWKAEETSAYALTKAGKEDYIHEGEIMGEVASYVGTKNCYTFNCDFRMGAEFCANQLSNYIADVLAYTGKEKVNILAVSHGGQVTSTYLALYGAEQNAVDNCVMTVPAIGGAGFAYDILTNNVHLDEEMLVRFIQHGMMFEDDFDWLVKAQECGFLDDVIYYLVPYIKQIMGYWGSIWDFIPAEYYEDCKQLLDANASAPLIESSDRFHNEILPTFADAFAECQSKGMNISIVAGTGNDIVTGLQTNSDGIICTCDSTGATCAPFGKRFADGYTQINECEGKNKVSPSLEVDASTAYLPDNTWFVNGLFHGMTYKDKYTIDLMMTLYLTHRLKDVYSSGKFPQFRDSSNPSYGIYAEFDGAAPGFVTSETGKLTVTNCCNNNSIKLTAVNFAGADLSVNIIGSGILAPGESAEFDVKGNIPAVSGKLITVTTSYIMFGSVTPVGERIQGFTVNNGQQVSYDGSTPVSYVVTGGAGILDRIVLASWPEAIRVFLNMFLKIFRYWGALISAF